MPRAMRARRMSGVGITSSFEEMEEGSGMQKRENASLISSSSEAEMLFSLASLDWRDFFSWAGLGVGGRRLGG